MVYMNSTGRAPLPNCVTSSGVSMVHASGQWSPAVETLSMFHPIIAC
jgi:hypothetical protein